MMRDDGMMEMRGQGAMKGETMRVTGMVGTMKGVNGR